MALSEVGPSYFVANQKCQYIRKNCDVGFSVCLLRYVTMLS
jgi:hypothetical protein